MNQQFLQVLERCRILLKTYDNMRQQKAHEYREKLAQFQVRKKIILRKTGQEIFETLREVEKSTLARTRRSLFGEETAGGSYFTYPLFLNRLLFSEDGRDDFLCAEHYVMLGNWDRDSDRYGRMREVVSGFLRSLYGEEVSAETLDAWMNVPENARILVGTGTPDDSPEGVAQQERLASWVRLLEDERVMENVIASYHVVPLLNEYAPRINPQQLKNALIDRTECDRVERMIKENGKLSPTSLYSAVAKVASCRGAERAKVAARFLGDFFHYHRDLRRLDILNGALDSVNLVANERLQEMSRVNGTLYEFLLPEEQGEANSERVLRHVVLKADVRDSTRLTRTMMDKGLNPASYFSLNFYDPVNKLLEKYGAQKVFLEGDAIILAILEREGEPGLAVSRMCVLAREIIEIVRGYNELMQRSAMPGLELGVGITLQESAPALSDGWRAPDHDFRSAERERPHVLLQQARPQNHGTAGRPVPRLRISSCRIGRGRKSGRRHPELQPGRHPPERRRLPPIAAGDHAGTAQSEAAAATGVVGQRRVPPVQRHRAGRPRHLPQNRRPREPHPTHRTRGFLGHRMDRAFLL